MRNKRIFVILLILCVLGAGIFLFLRLRGDSPEALRARADENFAKENYDAALLDYRKLLTENPKDAYAFRQAGLIWMERGAILRALPFLLEARKLEPDHLETRQKWAQVLMGIGDLRGVRTESTAILDQDPTNKEALLLLANTSFGEELISETRARLEKLDPSQHAVYHLVSAILASREGKKEAVLPALQQALALDSESVDVHLALATYHASERENEKALAALARASELAETRSNTHLRYAQELARSGKPEEAEKNLNEIIKSAPDYLPALRVLAELQAGKRDYEDALKTLDSVFKLDSVNLDARFVEARIHVANSEPAKALEVFKTLDEAYPEIPRVKYGLATYALRNNDQTKAREAFEAVLKKTPPASQLHADSAVLLAELDLRNGDTEESTTRLEELLKLRPDLPRLPPLLARAYQAGGRLEDAANVFRAEIAKAPAQPAPHFALAQILKSQDRPEDARASFEAAQKLAPEDQTVAIELVGLDLGKEDFASAHARVEPFLSKPEPDWGAWYLKGLVLSAEKNWPEAESALQKSLELKPGSTTVYNLLVDNYMKAGDPASAIARLQTLTEENPKAIQHRMLLATILEQEKKYEEAAKSYQSLLVANPTFVPALNNLAYLYSSILNRLPEAETLARRARASAPQAASVADTLGWILVQQGGEAKSREGLLLLKEAAASNDAPEIQYHLGIASLKTGARDEAQRALQQALTSQTTDAPWKADAKQALDQITGAGVALEGLGIADLEKLRKTDGLNVPVRLRLAALYEEQGDSDQAVPVYQELLKLDTKQFEALKGLARLLRTGNPAEARKFAERAWEANADDPEAAALQGRWLLQDKLFKPAYQLMKPAAAKSTDPALLADFGTAAYHVGKVDEARAALKKIPAGSPQHGTAATFLTLTANPDPDGAGPLEAAASAELARNPDSVPAQMVEAARLQRAGDSKGAAAIYEALRKRLPDFPLTLLPLAQIYAQDTTRLDEAESLALDAQEQIGSSAQAEIDKLLAEIKATREEEENRKNNGGNPEP